MGSVGWAGVSAGSGQLTVGGRYQLLALAGPGARRVWRAYDELMDCEVAVKELVVPEGTPAAARDEAQRRMEQRARAAGLVRDPGLLRILNVLHTTGRSWLVMPYVPSRSLHDRVVEQGPLTHFEATAVGVVLVRALRAAHAASVHGDVSPHSVLLADDGRVLLSSSGAFSAGLPWDELGGGRTQQLLGPPHYLAPERLRGSAPSIDTDLWSLGATLYTAVEARPPLSRPSVAQSWAAVFKDAIDPPQHPGSLHAVIARLLASDPACRATAVETQNALEKLRTRAVGVFPVPSRPRPTPHLESYVRELQQPTPPQSRRWGRRRRLLVAAMAALVVAAGGTASAWAYTTASHASASPRGRAVVAATVGLCAGATWQTLTETAAAPIPVPAGWRWFSDPTGFALPVPPDWTRAAINGVVCFSDPNGIRSLNVNSAQPSADTPPLLRWQAAEVSALAQGTLPGYERVALAGSPNGGADWEYTWQPGSGPRLHIQRVLLPAGDDAFDELSWVTRDADWAAATSVRNSVLAGFRDQSNSGSPVQG